MIKQYPIMNENKLTIPVKAGTFFALFLILLSCSNAKKTADDAISDITLNVISPTKCSYTFHFVKDSIAFSSSSLIYDSLGKCIYFRQLSRHLDSSISNSIFRYVNSLKSQQFEINRLIQTDAYQYELFFNGKLVGRAFCCNDAIYYILAKSLPCIDTRNIVCCDFFEMLKERPTLDSVITQ